MNCQSSEVILTELGRARPFDYTPDQTMQPNLHQSVLVHLDECTECAVKLQDGRALSNRLEEMAREMKSVTAPASIEKQLRKTFRQTLSRPVPASALSMRQRSEVRGQRSEIRVRWSRWVVAAAAVLLIVLGITGLRLRAGRQSQPESVRAETGGAQPAPKELPSSVEAGTNRLPSKPSEKSTVSVKRKNLYSRTTHPVNHNKKTSQPPTTETATAIANDTASEVATQFMPLAYAGPINLQDGGQLVRVELPRSAMLSMGLPVNMDRYSERVKADVLLGADGLARAIRFVQ
ncbi:MAG TPA: hypothetical protein VGJ48_11240 [Pyrinomonadaceae bacterium]|jgi:hypothetical protein